ncbi:MAG: hypothetical protein JWO91_84 [Acidobacteriaceae bacterium]|nr:hypothetical protein [Acidobacteriaceae bacterium]
MSRASLSYRPRETSLPPTVIEVGSHAKLHAAASSSSARRLNSVVRLDRAETAANKRESNCCLSDIVPPMFEITGDEEVSAIEAPIRFHPPANAAFPLNFLTRVYFVGLTLSARNSHHCFCCGRVRT